MELGNGIGAYWMPRLLRNYLNRRFYYFVNAANQHDIRYATKRMTRRHTDLQFIREMLQQCGNDLDVFVAVVFYVFVRLFGEISWRKHGE